MLISLLFNSSGDFLTGLILFLFVAGALVISLSFHEFAHAYTALKLGDPTANSLGRVTLNPKAHLDPMGTALLLLAAFGWGKPVPFDPYYLKNPKRDAALISIAGPLSNILLAIIGAVLFKIVPNIGVWGIFSMFLYFVIFFNLVLAFFNLIPVHPLDGFKVVNGFLPDNLSIQWLQTAPFGIYILLILIFTRTTSQFIDPLLNFSLKILGLSL